MHALWKESAAVVQPRSFKSKLARFAPNFSGYSQQDSQVREKQIPKGLGPRAGVQGLTCQTPTDGQCSRRYLRCHHIGLL
jgi:hypothetical protein